MKIVVVDGHTLNPAIFRGRVAALGKCQIYERSAPAEIVARCADAEIVLTNKAVLSRDQHILVCRKLKYIGSQPLDINR